MITGIEVTVDLFWVLYGAGALMVASAMTEQLHILSEGRTRKGVVFTMFLLIWWVWVLAVLFNKVMLLVRIIAYVKRKVERNES